MVILPHTNAGDHEFQTSLRPAIFDETGLRRCAFTRTFARPHSTWTSLFAYWAERSPLEDFENYRETSDDSSAYKLLYNAKLFHTTGDAFYITWFRFLFDGESLTVVSMPIHFDAGEWEYIVGSSDKATMERLIVLISLHDLETAA